VSTVKVGVLGGGGILDAHIRGYRAYADAIKVTAVADVVEETARRRAAELDAAAYTDFRQMILDADIDAVDICLPHHLHAEAIVAAAQAGKHILCEKPLCLTCVAGRRGAAGGQYSRCDLDVCSQPALLARGDQGKATAR
jgi:predicted dehydrogenase